MLTLGGAKVLCMGCLASFHVAPVLYDIPSGTNFIVTLMHTSGQLLRAL